MIVVLLLSKSTVSLQTPFCFPIFSLTPSVLKPAFSWMRRLPMFSENIPACNVHIPSTSLKPTSSSKSASPIPLPDCSGSTYTLTSATPEYTQHEETGFSAPQPTIFPLSWATILQVPRCELSHSSQEGALVWKVALSVAMPFS